MEIAFALGALIIGVLLIPSKYDPAIWEAERRDRAWRAKRGISPGQAPSRTGGKVPAKK